MEGCDYANEKDRIYTDECCTNHLEECLRNYDFNMEYFSLLNNNKFDAEINRFLENNNCFDEAFDLNLSCAKKSV